MKNLLRLIIVSLLLISLNSFAKPYEIGITKIAEHNVLDSVEEGFRKALVDNNIDAKIDSQNAQGDIITQQLITKQFAQQNKDLILAISTPSVQAAASSTKNIPILFGAVTSPEAAGVATIPNISGITCLISPVNMLKLINKFFPKYKSLGAIYNISEKNGEANINTLKKEAEAMNYKVNIVGVTSMSEMPSALDSLYKNSDAIFIVPDNLVISSMPLIYQKSKVAKIPVFSIGHTEEVIQKGAILGATIDYIQSGYEIGLMAIRILKGESIKNIPYEHPKEFPLIVNEKVLANFSDVSPEEIQTFYKTLK